MPGLSCLFNPIACVTAPFASVPTLWWILIAFGVGLLLGAIFRWPAVIAFFVGIGASLLAFRSRKGKDQPDLPFPEPLPRQRKPKIVVKQRPPKR